MTTVATSEVLNRAADLIEERGWTLGDGWDWMGTGRTPLCIEGAIGAASGIVEATSSLPFNTCPAGRAVRAYLGMTPLPLPPPTAGWPDFASSHLYRWNDTRRTATEVIEVLRAVALIEAAKEEADAAVELVTA